MFTNVLATAVPFAQRRRTPSSPVVTVPSIPLRKATLIFGNAIVIKV